MASVHDVAAAILAKQGPMSTWKLQKLVYYAQAWHVVWEDEPLFEDVIQAWANGPVVPALYFRHRGQFSVSTWDGQPERLTPRERSSIAAVLKTYGGLTGAQLSALTHQEPPWLDARGDLPEGMRGDHPIPLEAMSEYYGSLL